MEYACNICGSYDIEVKAWVEPNNHDKVVEWCEDEIPECWCNTCQEMTTYRKAIRTTTP